MGSQLFLVDGTEFLNDRFRLGLEQEIAIQRLRLGVKSSLG
jgi:hypothetical protein